LLIAFHTPARTAATGTVTYPFHDTSFNVSNTPKDFWCYVVGDNTAFPVVASSTTFIGKLKDLIKEKGKNGVLNSVDAKDLILWKVRMSLVVIRSDITGDTTLAYGGYPCQAI
jgi:hypothetical protein